ncbi:MAG TPA: hypothetical protein VJH90_01755 [archaeon]|nr:hypothetical protein [archaeon]
MAKKQNRGFNLGRAWFVLVLLIAVVASVIPFNQMLVYLVLAVAGASIAIVNVRIVEEQHFLLAIAAFTVICLSVIMLDIASGNLEILLKNLVAAFGTTGFVIAVAQISKISLNK